MTRSALWTLAALGSFSTTAAADPAYEVRMEMYAHAEGVQLLKQQLAGALRSRFTEATCRQAIANARSGGLPDSFEIKSRVYETFPKAYTRDGDWFIRLADATVICEQVGKWRKLGEAQHYLGTLGAGFFNDLAYADPNRAGELTANATECSARVDGMIANGIAVDVAIPLGSGSVTIADAKARVCEPLVERAKTYAQDVIAAKRAVDEAERQRVEKIAAPYKAVGMKGDRLQLMIDHPNYAMYGIGGGELTTPKQLKNARVIFELLGRNDDWTLRRYEFRGDKLLKTTQEGFLKRPGLHAYR